MGGCFSLHSLPWRAVSPIKIRKMFKNDPKRRFQTSFWTSTWFWHMQNVFAGILFSIGFIFLTVAVSSLAIKNPTPQDRSAAAGGIMVGVPALAAATWLVWKAKKKQDDLAEVRQRQLEFSFLTMLQANEGSITPISFAIANQLSLEEAKQYLDKKATLLNADFNVTEDGGVSYKFYLS